VSAQPLGAAIGGARARLAAAGIETAALDARLLAAHAFGTAMAELIGHPERPIADDQAALMEALVDRRIRREPLAYIIGRREFWSLSLRVSPATLIPRPDSETVVEAALAWAGRRHEEGLRVLDLGTGSGCLLLALLVELPNAWGVGIDISQSALAVARSNADEVGVGDRAAFVRSSWADALTGEFDLIVSNPPYIADREWPELPQEVREHEPFAALSGGFDGADAYRSILPALPALLAPGGAAFLEIGGTSAGPALRSGFASNLELIETRADLSGRARSLAFCSRSSHERKKNLGNQSVPV
jgi:release factor glutamine methyltransferase